MTGNDSHMNVGKHQNPEALSVVSPLISTNSHYMHHTPFWQQYVVLESSVFIQAITSWLDEDIGLREFRWRGDEGEEKKVLVYGEIGLGSS